MCKLCETYDFTRIGIDIDSWGDKPTIFFSGGSGQTPNDQRFRYCPACGKQIIYKEDGENDNAAMAQITNSIFTSTATFGTMA